MVLRRWRHAHFALLVRDELAHANHSSDGANEFVNPGTGEASETRHAMGA